MTSLRRWPSLVSRDIRTILFDLLLSLSDPIRLMRFSWSEHEKRDVCTYDMPILGQRSL